jgi:hypothetical protein
MPGEPDPLYVLARKVLIDALNALEPHLDALVLVGAQAIYLHTGDANLAVAEYTTDGDLALEPAELADAPVLEDALRAAKLRPGDQPGRWISPEEVYVDLLVPEALAGAGRRGARLGPHGNVAARRARGLEGALVDRERMVIAALDAADTRSHEIWVAGPGALVVAKVHKIAERVGDPSRERDKDALDVLRVLRAIPTETLAERLNLLASSDLAGEVTAEARVQLTELFVSPDAEAVVMAVRAAGPEEDADTIAASLVALVQDLLDAWRGLPATGERP